MKQTTSLAVGVATALLGSAITTSVYASPVIGFNPDGNGDAGTFLYAQIWSDAASTGVDVTNTLQGINGTNPGGIPNPSVGDIHEFSTQFTVSSFTSPDGTTFNPPGLNGLASIPGSYELTKELNFLDQVSSFIGDFGAPGSAIQFNYLADDFNNLTVYFDPYNNSTDQSQSDAGDGAGTVACYGSNTNCAGVDDGLNIMTGNLINNTSGFQLSADPNEPGVGVGSFDLLFEITSWDPDYLDLSNLPVNGGTGNPLYAMRITGNLSQPLQDLTPDVMWDGTSTTGTGFGGVPNQAFSITAAESFVPMPAPGTLGLVGLALAGLGAFRGRRRDR